MPLAITVPVDGDTMFQVDAICKELGVTRGTVGKAAFLYFFTAKNPTEVVRAMKAEIERRKIQGQIEDYQGKIDELKAELETYKTNGGTDGK